MKPKIVKYEDIRDCLKTGDVINCEHHNWFWRLIGHTAVVYRDPLTDMLFCFESTSIGKSGISGVQLNPLGEWVKGKNGYTGKVFIRYAVFSQNFQFANLPFVFIEKYRGTSYPDVKSKDGRDMLIASAVDIEIGDKDLVQWHGKVKSIFCSMLVVMFLRWLGIMSRFGLPDYEFEPDDFRDGKTDKLSKCLKDGIKYEQEIQVI